MPDGRGLAGETGGSSLGFSPHPELRRNFLWAGLNGALFEFGASFVETGTVVAAFVGRLSPAAWAVGAAASIARVGWLVPQLFAAHYARARPYRKPLYLVAGWGRALCLAVLALVLLAAGPGGDPGGPALLVAFFALWTAFSFVSGLAGVPYNDVIARTIPSEWRSRLLATRLFLGGALAVGGGLLIRAILQHASDGPLQAYGLIFGLGACVLAASTGCFALIREPRAPATVTRRDFWTFLRDGLGVLRGDCRFRRFLYAQLAGGVTRMAMPFYVLQAQRVSGLPEFEVGTLLAAQTVGSVALNPLWGWWGDRRGKLGLLKLLTVVSAVSPAVALALGWAGGRSATPTLAGYAAAFFFVGVTLSGEIIADLGYLMEISPEERRPEYTGYMNALVAPSRLLPLLGGVVVQSFSFQALFALAAAGAVARYAALTRVEASPPLGGRG